VGSDGENGRAIYDAVKKVVLAYFGRARHLRDPAVGTGLINKIKK
jgi:hypothetical protein